MSWNCQGISQYLESGHPVDISRKLSASETLSPDFLPRCGGDQVPISPDLRAPAFPVSVAVIQTYAYQHHENTINYTTILIFESRIKIYAQNKRSSAASVFLRRINSFCKCKQCELFSAPQFLWSDDISSQRSLNFFVDDSYTTTHFLKIKFYVINKCI